MKWQTLSKFAQGIASGMSASEAYRQARPNADLTPESVTVMASRLLSTVKVKSMVAHYREALVERSTEDFILNRDEKRRLLTMVAITPVGQVDETSILAQEVKYKYATHPITGATVLDEDGNPMVAEKVVKMIPKQFAIGELNKMDAHYEAEKAPLPSKSLTYGIEDAHEAFSHDPMYLEFLKEAAVFEAAKRGKIIEVQEAPVPPARRTQAELDAALDADEDFQNLTQ